MADKTIGSLPAATSVDDESLFVIEQQGAAMRASGMLWKHYAEAAAQYQAEAAAASATAAAASANSAEQSAQDLENAVEATDQNVAAAQAAQQSAESAQASAKAAEANAEAAQAAAESAQSNAQAAQQIAETAAFDAQTAQVAAETAQSAAEAAKADAIDASAQAQGAASDAATNAQNAADSASAASDAQYAAQTASNEAQAAQQAIENLGVAGITLPAGTPLSVSKSVDSSGAVTLTFSIPQGEQGIQGNPGTDVDSIARTSGTGAPGTTDTYTMYASDGSVIGTFNVYNGANGTGTGDFMADGSVPMSGSLQMGGNKVVNVADPTEPTDGASKGYVDNAISSVQITTDATPVDGSANPVQSGGVYDALAGKQDVLTGMEGQLVGFSSSGAATPVPIPTASDIGAVPTSRTVNGKALSSNITLTAADVGAGPGKRTARFTVGTSAAGWTASDCDYLCDGTDDQVEINAAIQALPTTGGEVVVLDGTYNITAAISVNKNNVKLSGNGAATVLKRMWNSSTDEGVINIVAINGNCTVESLLVDGNNGPFNSNNNIGIQIFKESSAGVFPNYSSNNAINKCICKDSHSGIRISGDLTHNNTVIGNTCNSNINHGIHLDNNSTNNTITGNTCINNNTGISISGYNNTITGNTCNSDIGTINNNTGISISGYNNTIAGNTCNNNLSGIQAELDSDNNTIAGNTCIRGTGTAEDYLSIQYTIRCGGKNNLITGNNIMGKNYVDTGTGNTWANNKYE